VHSMSRFAQLSKHLHLCAVHTDPAAAQPLKSDTNGSGDMGDPSDEEAAELHELLQQMNDPAVRCTTR
jgi:hypothetical protein